MVETDRLRAPLTLGYRAKDADPAVAALVALTHRIAARHRKEWDAAGGEVPGRMEGASASVPRVT
ncbi:hypothetical protein D3C85_1893010 [compost metagenome]